MISFTQYLEEEFDLLWEEHSLLETKAIVTDENQPWSKSKGTPEEIYNIARKLADKNKSAFSRMLQKATSGSAKVLVAIKPEKSFISKIKRGKSIAKIHDVLRGAILANTEEEAEKAVKFFQKNARILEFEKKDKPDKEFGYFGSFHIKMLLGGMIVEVQIMTKKLWSYKKAAHKIYNKLRELDNDIPPDVATQEKNLSKFLFKKGNLSNVRTKKSRKR